MREKLLVLMKNEGLTSSRLAELLGIQPSGISHILGGRNKPSFDFVQKILRRFPRINPDWLLLDSEQMYRDLPTDNSQPAENTIFSAAAPTVQENEQNHEEVKSPEQTTTSAATALINSVGQTHGAIKRVIVLFEDRTFESYDVGK